MKINGQLYISLLEEEVEYRRKEASISIKDMEREEIVQRDLEKEIGELFFRNNMERAENDKLQLIYKELNDDFFILGDMFMQAIKDSKNGNAFSNLDEFLVGQYEARIDNMEEIIFDFGDDIEHREDIISDAAEDINSLKKEIADIQAEWAQESSQYKKIDSEQRDELVDKRKTIIKLEDEAKMKEKVRQEGIYADKKYRFDLEQKISALQKENTELIKLLGDVKDDDGEKKMVTSGDNSGRSNENKTGRIKWPAKDLLTGEAIKEGLKEGMEASEKEVKKIEDPRDPKEIAMIACKNKLCNKGYGVKVEGELLIATKDGTRKIEVSHAELPGSLKYAVCGQIFYEFDKAVKASIYGVKAIMPKIEPEESHAAGQ